MTKKLTFIVLLLGIFSLFAEQNSQLSFLPWYIPTLIDFLIVFLSVTELILELSKATYPWLYLRRNLLSILFLGLFLVFFFISKYFQFFAGESPVSSVSGLIIFRNVFLLLKIFSRFQKLNIFLQNIVSHPSQTLVLSFLMVIIAGALLLTMPFSSSDGVSFPLIDSLFTATSAVCVTGLAVADTSVQFSIWGHIVILLLIQIGGLGIMILSFSTIFLFRKSVSMENKMLISYMIDEDDMTRISSMLKSITFSTFVIEAGGAVILFAALPSRGLSIPYRIFYALFHSVSAFCNAGFSLFTDSLESVPGSLVPLTIGGLIILGSFSFSALFDLKQWSSGLILSVRNQVRNVQKLKVNTRIVLAYSSLLVLSGMFVVYFLEHGNTMKDMGTGSQYIHAFFQSVTLRTAGFNSISFSSLGSSTLVIMIVYMFIGGASGSTAGGIKLNTLAVILASIRSYWVKDKSVTLYNHQIKMDDIIRAFMILFLGIILVMSGLFLLTLTETAAFKDLLFETVSAFGTVGLSTGVTSSLSSPGKMVIMFLMFLGRLGPLTLVAAAGSGSIKSVRFSYPEADISIG